MKRGKIYGIHIEQAYTYRTILLILIGIGINVIFPRLAIHFSLPLYLDNIGSVLVASLAGPISGMITAFTSNYLGYFGEPSAIMFGVLTVTMAYIGAKISEKGLLRKKKGYLVMWIMMVIIGGAMGSIMGWYLYGQTIGGTIAAPYAFWFRDHGMSDFAAQFLGDVILDMTDKAITLGLVAAVLLYFPKKLRGAFPLSYIYGCSDEELEMEYKRTKNPFGRYSIFNKMVRIMTIALLSLSILVTWYGTSRYFTGVYLVEHDTYALFAYVVQLIGLEFVVIILVMAFTKWMFYQTLKKPIDAIVSQSEAFRVAKPEKWLEMDEWNNRYVINTKDEIQFLYETICQSEESISKKVASIKENEKKFKHLSEIDLMTGLCNRGSGERKISHEIANGVEGLFCILDCDKFKEINDTYGHDVGDIVIISVAEKMKELLGEKDIILRLGGDEFSIYLPGICDEKGADEFIDSFFKNMKEIKVKEINDKNIYISMGASFNRAHTSSSFDELYKKADRALYQSKKVSGYSATIL